MNCTMRLIAIHYTYKVCRRLMICLTMSQYMLLPLACSNYMFTVSNNLLYYTYNLYYTDNRLEYAFSYTP